VRNAGNEEERIYFGSILGYGEEEFAHTHMHARMDGKMYVCQSAVPLKVSLFIERYMCVAVCCSVLQCVAMCCSVLQCVREVCVCVLKYGCVREYVCECEGECEFIHA